MSCGQTYLSLDGSRLSVANFADTFYQLLIKTPVAKTGGWTTRHDPRNLEEVKITQLVHIILYIKRQPQIYLKP